MKAVIESCMNEGLIVLKFEWPECKKYTSFVQRKEKSDGYEWVCQKS